MAKGVFPISKSVPTWRTSQRRSGSHAYDRAAGKDDFAPGTYKCNKFDYDIERTARVTPIMVRDNDTGQMRPATAGERATQLFEGWRRVSRNERRPGDEAAMYSKQKCIGAHWDRDI